MRTLERPALGRVLATVTDRPVGHWIAELRSPAFRGGWEIQGYGAGSPRIGWRFETDFARKTTARRNVPLAITDPAEALETLCQRSVLPVSFVGDVTRGWACVACAGRGHVPMRPPAYGFDPCRRCAVPCSVCGSKEWVRTHGDFADPCHPDGLVRRGWTTEPATIADLLAWASLGAETIARAEHLARTTAERLRPWGVRPPVETATTPDGHAVPHERPWRVVWRIADPREACGTTVPPSAGWPREVGRRADRRSAAWQDAYESGVRSLGEKTLRGLCWARGITAGYCAVWSDPRPNPYEPLRDLYALGLVLLAIESDALVLVCPPLDESP